MVEIPSWAWVALQVADTLKAGGNAESAVHIIQHIILAHGLLIGISWEVHLEGMIQGYCGMGKQVVENNRLKGKHEFGQQTNSKWTGAHKVNGWYIYIYTESAFQHDFGAEIPTELPLKWGPSWDGWLCDGTPLQAIWSITLKKSIDASQKCWHNPDS